MEKRRTLITGSGFGEGAALGLAWEAHDVNRHGIRFLPSFAGEDITHRKRAESLTAQVFERAPDGICIVGRDYRYWRSNPVYARGWGIAAERIVGMHVSELLGADAFDRTLRPKLDRCFGGEEVEFEWLSESRGQRYLAVAYSPLRWGSEEVEAALVIQRDLTDCMRASEALREVQAELAHVNRVATMGQLTASIAHEVSQPIAATVIDAQAAQRWLAAQPPDLGEVRRALERIVKSGNRAGDVIGRIRALMTKAPPRKDRLDINEAIREVIVLTRSEATKNGVLVQTQLVERLPPIEGDRVQLQQVILNLIINAIEATSGVGEGARELLIATGNAETGGVFVAVRDSGPGLKPADLEHVFDAFYTTKSGGMGMGLAICRSIIEARGGRVWATPNSPRGAIFQFNIPVHEPRS
jgi:PAS domain S-box-containing protein